MADLRGAEMDPPHPCKRDIFSTSGRLPARKSFAGRAGKTDSKGAVRGKFEASDLILRIP